MSRFDDVKKEGETVHEIPAQAVPFVRKILLPCRFALGLVLPAVLTACTVGAGLKQTALPERIDYHCAHSRVLKVKRLLQQNAAVVLVGEQQPVTLPRVQSAAQEKYSDGRYTLYLQGERAMLEDNGQVLFGPCQAGPLPKQFTDGFRPD